MCLEIHLNPHMGTELTEVGQGYKHSTLQPQGFPSSSKAEPLKGSVTLPNCATSRGPNVQIHKPVGDISHLSHTNILPFKSNVTLPYLLYKNV